MDDNAREFLLKEYESLQQRIATDIAHQRQVAISAVLASAAVWSWLAANGSTDFASIAESIPFVLSLLALIGTVALDAHIKKIGKYLHKVETAFQLSPDLGWEHSLTPEWHGQAGKWGAAFWIAFGLCLMSANLVGALYHH